jgi:hypothetical protein
MVYDKLRGEESQEETEQSLEEAQYNLGIFCGLIKESANEKAAEKYRSAFQRIKEDFIQINIIHKTDSIFREASRLLKKRLSEEKKQELLSSLIMFLKKTKVVFAEEDVPGEDKDYRGPAQYISKDNTVVFEQFEKYWVNGRGQYEFKNTVFHELGHAKEEALNRTLKGWFPVMPKMGQIYKPYYSGGDTILARLNKCFPKLKNYHTEKHAEVVWEFYASLQEIYGILGRSRLLPIDVQLACAARKGKITEQVPIFKTFFENPKGIGNQWIKTLSKKTITSDPSYKDGFSVSWTAKDFINNEIWDTFDCKTCGPKFVANMLNSLAKVVPKHKAKSQMAESNNDGTMFGVGRAHLGQNLGGNHKVAPDEPNRDNVHNEPEETFSLEDLGLEIKNMIADKLKEKENQVTIKTGQEQEDLEEISAMGAGAVEGAGGPFGIRKRKRKPSKKPIEETTIKLANYLLKISGEQ